MQPRWTQEEKMLSELMEITNKYSATMNCFKVCEILMCFTFSEIVENSNCTEEAIRYALELVDKNLKLLDQ